MSMRPILIDAPLVPTLSAFAPEFPTNSTETPSPVAIIVTLVACRGNFRNGDLLAGDPSKSPVSISRPKGAK
jgi:hypothetical protein